MKRWASRYVAMMVASGACHKPQEATTKIKKQFLAFLSVPVSLSPSHFPYLCCVCLSKAGHTMLFVASVAGCLFTCLLSVLVVVVTGVVGTLVVVSFVVLVCWRLQCNKSVLTHLFSNFFCYYFRHQQRTFAFVRQP